MRSNVWWRVAWRNLGRNRRRTVLAASALALGYAAVVVIGGAAAGVVAEMIENGTGFVTGQLQVHAPGFLPDRHLYATIGGTAGADMTGLVEAVESHPAIDAAAPRLYGGGLLSSGEATTSGVLLGIDPAREPRVGRLARSVVDGRAPGPGQDGILVGSGIARRLSLRPGDTLVVVAPAADGSLGNDAFLVSGIFRTGLPSLDDLYAVFPMGSLQALLALEAGRVHEIAATAADPWAAPAVADELSSILGAAGLEVEVRPWSVLRPEIVEYAGIAGAANRLVLAIVFGIAVFGVANTLAAATFERRREFALLLAMGTAPSRIALSVVYEALALGVVGAVVGGLISLPVLVWWHVAPFDVSWAYGDSSLAGALIRPVLRVEYTPALAAWTALALLGTAVLAALFPAARAARLPPAEGLSGA